MTDAEQRRRNRARVGHGYGDEKPVPGLTGVEIRHLEALAGVSTRELTQGQRAKDRRRHPWRAVGGLRNDS